MGVGVLDGEAAIELCRLLALTSAGALSIVMDLFLLRLEAAADEVLLIWAELADNEST